MMSVFVSLLLTVRSSVRSQIEVLALRHQLHVLQRSRSHRVRLTPVAPTPARGRESIPPPASSFNVDRPDAVGVARALETRLALGRSDRQAGDDHQVTPPRLSPVLEVEESTAHGTPGIPVDVGALIREMSTANPFWGAPRIHG
jgi:hypothetical protein